MCAKTRMSRILGSGILSLIWVGLTIFPAHAGEDPHLFFVGISGEAVQGKTPVLLRWFSFDGSVPVQSYSIYRKQGDAASTQPLTQLSLTGKIRNESLIRSVFEQPTQKRAKEHIQDLLAHILEEPVTDSTYVPLLLSVLDSTCDECEFRRKMLINSNYGVAIIEGLGYLDPVPPDIYTYELRTSKGTGGTDDLVLGRITVDATNPSKLPPPQKPEVVDVSGEKGDKRIFLYWELSPELKDKRTVFFAYNVYRGEGDVSGDDFFSLLMAGKLKQVNRLPILPPSAQALGTKPEDRYVFVDDNLLYKKTGLEGIPFNPGDVYTYWVTPIDLLGQDGDPSQPVVVMVPDKSAPQVPRGLLTKAAENTGVQRIVLSWDRNTDDTTGYKVYRFRSWDHVGKKDSFPPVGGVTEGYISDIAQSPSEAPVFTDTTVDESQNENEAFWYCVSAFDIWGNESALSAPYRGIISDTKPPEAPSQVQICSVYYRCQLTIDSISPFISTIPENNGRVAVELHIRHPEPVEESLFVHIKRVVTCSNPELIPPVDTEIFSGVLEATQSIDIRDEFPRPDDPTINVTYWITTLLDGRQVCQSFTIPDDPNRLFFMDYLRGGASLTVNATLRVGTEYQCEPATSGEKAHDTYDDYGNVVPVTFDVPQSQDALGVILYRSPDCENFYQVDEFRYKGAKTLKTKDLFAPDQGGRICYGVRYFDENHNLSPLYYIPIFVKFPGGKTTEVVPSLTGADPLGDLTAPGVYLTWFGSNVGLAGFRIEIADTEDFTGTLRTRQVGLKDFSFVEKDNEFQTSLDVIDDKTKEKLQIDKTYYIRVTSLLQNGQERVSNNYLKFIWSADKTPHEHPNWPVRPLPPTSPDLKAAWMPGGEGFDRFSSGVVLQLGQFESIDPENFGPVYDVSAPFIVYRHRIDIPNRPYIQVSPLIDRIAIRSNELVSDPFIIYAVDVLIRDAYAIAYLDTVDLIEGGQYEYKIVKLNEKTGEIERVYGPSNPVEVKRP